MGVATAWGRFAGEMALSYVLQMDTGCTGSNRDREGYSRQKEQHQQTQRHI